MEQKTPNAYIRVFAYPDSLSVRAYIGMCTPLRRERLERLACAGGRESGAVKQSLAAELAFLACLEAAKEAGEDFSTVYSYEKGGRPVLERGFMSLSHTDGAACCVLSSVPVGIDVEKRRSVSPRLIRRLLNAEELAAYEAAEDPEDRERFFLRAWTAKESAAKLIGAGLSALRAVTLREDGVIAPDGTRLALFCEEICLSAPGERASLAVCTAQGAKHLLRVFTDPEPLLSSQ